MSVIRTVGYQGFEVTSRETCAHGSGGGRIEEGALRQEATQEEYTSKAKDDLSGGDDRYDGIIVYTKIRVKRRNSFEFGREPE